MNTNRKSYATPLMKYNGQVVVGDGFVIDPKFIPKFRDESIYCDDQTLSIRHMPDGRLRLRIAKNERSTRLCDSNGLSRSFPVYYPTWSDIILSEGGLSKGDFMVKNKLWYISKIDNNKSDPLIIENENKWVGGLVSAHSANMYLIRNIGEFA